MVRTKPELTRDQAKRQQIAKGMEFQARELASCFNNTIVTQLREKGLIKDNDESLTRRVKANFTDTDKIKTYVEIDTDFSISIERLGKSVRLVPDQNNDGCYSLVKGQTSAEKARDMLQAVNNELRSNGLPFKYAAGGEPMGTVRTGSMESGYTVSNKASEITRVASQEARTELGIDPL